MFNHQDYRPSLFLTMDASSPPPLPAILTSLWWPLQSLCLPVSKPPLLLSRPLLPSPLLHGTFLAHPLFCSFGTFVKVTSLWWDFEVLGHVCASLCSLVYFSESHRSWLYMCKPFPQHVKTNITHRRKCCYIFFIISPFGTRASP